jgi:uncharacterized protein
MTLREKTNQIYNDSMPAGQVKLKRYLLVIIGTIFVIIGVIGMVIPVLPTTPFLLLAAICYMRGSPRLYQRLVSNRFCGSYIKNYLEGRGMSLKNKVLTLTLLWLAIVSVSFLLTDSLIIRIILGVILIGVTAHILRIKTARGNPAVSSHNAEKII